MYPVVPFIINQFLPSYYFYFINCDILQVKRDFLSTKPK